MINMTIPLIEAYQKEHGALPSSLNDLSSLPKLRPLGIFSPPALNYRRTDASYRIDYHQFPLGPFHGYNSAARDWTCEE